MRRTALLGAAWMVWMVACASGGGGTRTDAGPSDGAPEDVGEMADVVGMDVPGGGDDCAMLAEGSPCDADGDGCSQDICRGGRCQLGGIAACDDGLSCTTDRCVSTGPMTFRCETDIVGCAIEGVCFDDGARNPDQDCEVCQNSQPTAWSQATGACDDGDACTVDDTCAGGVCSGAPRVDSFEPNESSSAAARIMGIDDGAGFPEHTERATLYPDGDEDWFVFSDSDEFGASIFPRVGLRAIPAGTNYDLCAYGRDVDGGSCDVACETGSADTHMGMPGCCSRNGGTEDEDLRLNPDCSGADDSVDVFVVVRRVSGPPICDTEYQLLWGDS